ncbi:MAG: SDR family NAD(P)-dependent oxidoreductase [Myxococcales bacterium]|nr:SDR family NAD(P)-dependent oxidoreductase [Myxococcales bacterium]
MRHGVNGETTATVVVTGGTGALGRAVLRAFFEVGDRVTAAWLVASERDEVASLFAPELADGRLELVEADVAEAKGAAEVARVAGPARALVNGVGGFEGGLPVHEADLEVWDRMYRINVRTAVAMSRAVLPGMFQRGHGAIINIGAQAAAAPPARLAAYSASKAAVVNLTRSLHAEAGDAGIRVNAVIPTTIDTPANRKAMPEADPSTWTPPSRVAEVIVWLASDRAATVRGGMIPV